MAKVPLITFRISNSINASTTNYICVANGYYTGGAPTIEASNQITYRVAGTISNLYIRVVTNDRGASTVRSRINGANGSQVASITASTTGEFEDITNSDAVAATDEVNASLVTGAGGTVFSYRIVSIILNPTSGTSTLYYAGSGASLSTAGSTLYSNIVGSIETHNATEASVQQSFRTAGTLNNFFVNVRTNTRSDATTYRVRVNAGNGNQSVSVNAAATGIHEDTTNSEAIVSGDEVDVSTTVGAGSGGIRLYGTCLTFTTTDRKGHIFSADTGGTAFLSGTTYYPQWGSYSLNDITESDGAVELNTPINNSSNYSAYVSANSSLATSTLQLRKNAGDANQTLSIGTLLTGLFEDTTNTDSFLATDEIGNELVVGAGGTSVTIQAISLLAEYPSDGNYPTGLLLMGVGM